LLRIIRLIRPAHAAVAVAVVCGLAVATFAAVDAADPRGTPRALASSRPRLLTFGMSYRAHEILSLAAFA
jgi:hypothetical protein